MKKIVFLLLPIFCIFCYARPARAQEMSADFQKQMLEMKSMIQGLQSSMADLRVTVVQQNEVIQEQTTRLNALEGQSGVQPTLIAPNSGPLQMKGLSQGINPDIGVSGTVMANFTEDTEDGEGKDTIALRELEIGFSQYVDPYSRLDAILAFNDNLEDQNVDIEEAYYSHFGLPFGFKTQIGKFRAKIGKENMTHLHALDTSTYSLVLQDFFGEEGLASSGARLVNNIPNPWDIPLELTGEVLRGNNGATFSGISRIPIFNTHLKTFFETSENSDLELGWTSLFGDENRNIIEVDADGNEFTNRPESGRTRYGMQVFGSDATWNWRLSEGRAVKFQNEVYFSQSDTNRRANQNPWGFYSLIDYRFSKRFSAGLRFDYLEPLDLVGEHGRTTAVSPYLTLWQSEFANFRIQYTHTEPAAAAARSNDEVFLQANFLIGSHQHPVQ